MRRAHLFVSGKVQGVFYRSFASEIAKGLGLKGFVRNLSDGRVEIIVEGTTDNIVGLVKELRKGPKYARVDDIEMQWGEPTKEFEVFEVRHRG